MSNPLTSLANLQVHDDNKLEKFLSEYDYVNNIDHGCKSVVPGLLPNSYVGVRRSDKVEVLTKDVHVNSLNHLEFFSNGDQTMFKEYEVKPTASTRNLSVVKPLG